MADSCYRFLAALSSEDGSPLGQSPIIPDWYPATESARFQALRRGRTLSSDSSEHILPIWDPVLGAPYLSGVQIMICDQEGGEISCEVPHTYFRSQVQSISTQFVAKGLLKEGDFYHYRIAAFAAPDKGKERDEGRGKREEEAMQGWNIREVPISPICGERSLEQYQSVSQSVGEANADDYPVFIPRTVLEQAEALKDRALEKETGGILIGYLWRDTQSLELFAEITALVPAQHTVAQSTSLTFTPETWEAVQAAIQLRNRGEIFLAWHHTHPSRYWCTCPLEQQRHCPLGQQFFSKDDRSLHRTVFTQGFHTALVTGDRPLPEGGWEMVHALYGWRKGMIEPRSFYLLEAKDSPLPSEL